jgi:hypothetical protein
MTHPIADGVWFYNIWQTQVYNSFSDKIAGKMMITISKMSK